MTDDLPDLSGLATRDRLIHAAAHLFRRNGYHGVGLAEILAAAGAPKGSLYHHFPAGKSDLALAAADWAGAELARVLDASFDGADSFSHGVTTFCHKLAKLFDLTGRVDGCPVSTTLFEGPDNPAFRARAAQIFDDWIAAATRHGARFGLPEAEARDAAEALLMGLEGAWVLARARRSSDPLRAVPRHLGHSAG